MLVQHQSLPCFAVTGDYCPSSSTRSTQTQPFARIFGLSIPVGIVLNTEKTLNHSHLSFFPSCANFDAHQVNFPSENLSNILTPVTTTMPRHSRSNEKHDMELPVFTEPLGPIIAGCKRDASALSANCAAPPITSNTNLTIDSSDHCTIYLPPKPKESERMMHIQRWVNHLPWNINNCDGTNRSHVPYPPLPVRPHIDDDRELTPPPGRSYLTRLPFTAEEHQAMMRFFPSHTNQYRSQHQNPILEPQPRYNSYANQQQSNNHHFSSSQRPSQEAGTGFQHVRHLPDYIHEPERKREQEQGGSRLFTDWETRLISRLFKEFFHANPKPTGVTGTLPSLSEVRSRIASSRLKDTRTATAVRSKIRRMQSSGTWLKYQ